MNQRATRMTQPEAARWWLVFAVLCGLVGLILILLA